MNKNKKELRGGIERILHVGNRRKRFRQIVAMVIVFVTVYALILPAVALERKNASNLPGLDLGQGGTLVYACPFVVHEHTEECYKEVPVFDKNGTQTGTKKVLNCGKEDWVVHEHDENCYLDGKLVCTLPEHKEHIHDEKKCYEMQPVLSCGKEETAGHHHTDACYEETKTLACGKTEHKHTDACYSEVEVGSDQKLVCGYDEGEVIQEAEYSDPVYDDETGELLEDSYLISDAVVHHHSDDCYETETKTERLLTCGLEEHIHSNDCYNTERTLVCGEEEGESHKHTKACYKDEKVLTCRELTPHIHDLDCYERGPNDESPAEMGWVMLKDENDPVCKEITWGDPDHLICGKTELLVHQHDENCFRTAEEPAEDEVAATADEGVSGEDAVVDENSAESDNADDSKKDGLITLYPKDEDQADDAEGTADGEAADTEDAEKAAEEDSGFTRKVEVEGAPYSLIVSGNAEGAIPEDAEFRATALEETREDYEAYRDKALAAVDEYTSKKEDNSRAQEMPGLFDLTIYDAEGNEIQPAAPLSISIEMGDAISEDAAGVYAVHFPGTNLDTVMSPAADNPIGKAAQVIGEKITGNETEVIETVTEAAGNVQFEAESLSVYAIVYTKEFHTEVISASGDTYEVTVRYGADAKIPEDAELRVREILPEDDEYKAVQEKAGNELEDELKNAISAHPALFDIAIYDGETEIEPAEGSSVQVEIKLAKSSVTGIYTDQDSPVLINDKPLETEKQEITQELQVIHDVKDGNLEVVDLKEINSDENVIGRFTTESFSNYLVFLDQDVEEITVGRGDTITLRPYSQWVWSEQNKVDGQTVSWKQPDTQGHMTWERKSYTDSELGQTYEYYQLTATTNPGEFYLETTAGKKIKVTVKNENISGVPGTVQGLDTIKVNLFNYDLDKSLDVQANVASYIDADQNGDYKKFEWNQNGQVTTKTQGPYANDGINEGSALKFLGWGASNGGNRINNYVSTTPTTGIVSNTLATGTDGKKYPKLNGNGDTNLQYLFSAGNSDVEAHMGVTGLFRQDEDGYYYFNSNTNYAIYNADNTFTLYEHTYTQATTRNNTSGKDQNSKPIGFFPFHAYDSNNDLSPNHDENLDHHFGLSMEVKFVLPADKKLHKAGGVTDDIIFEFSGDDDMWVFIDDNLSLDVGGIHQPITRNINFTNDNRFEGGKEYTLRIFYLERGGCDSNCSIRFNIPLTKRPFSFEKQDENDKSKFLKGAKFGLFKDAECKIAAVDDTNGEEYTAVSNIDGVVSFPSVSIGTYYMKELEAPEGYKLDETVRIVKLTEDGVTIEGDADSGREGVQIANQKNPELTVEKKWQSQDGKDLSAPEDASATFQLKRYVSYEGDKIVQSQPCTFSVYRIKDNSTKQEGVYTFKGNTSVSVNWGYDSGYIEYDSSRKGKYKKNTDESNFSIKPDNGPAVIDLPESGQASIYIYDADLNTQYDPGILNITVNGTPYDPAGTIEHVKSDWAEDTQYTGPSLKLPDKIDNEHPWKGKFSNLIATEKKEGLTYHYKYYVVETEKMPTNSTVVYVDGSGNEVSDPSTLKTDQTGTQTVFNKVPNGKLKIKKEVQYNNAAPPADKKVLFEGDYTFTVCKDKNGLQPYLDEHNEPLKFTVHIGKDAEASESEVKELPPGVYYIREDVAADAQIVPVGTNPQEVTVTSGSGTSEAAIHTVTNNLLVNEADDNLTLDIEKKFSGINGKTDIPEDFQIVVTYKLNGTQHEIILKCEESHTTTDGLRVNITHSDDGLSWKWHVYGINENSSNVQIKEINYTKSGYELKASYNGTEIKAPDEPSDEQTVPLTAGAATITEVEDRTTSQTDMGNYILSDDYVVLVAITGNVHGTAVISKRSLNMAERDAITKGIPNIPNGPFENSHMWFYSEEEHFIEGRDVTVSPVHNRNLIFKTENGKHVIVCPPSSNKQAVAYSISYGEKPSITNAIYTNDYTETGVDLNVIKIAKDDENKKLSGAKFRVTLLDEEQTTVERVVTRKHTVDGEEKPVFIKKYGPTDEDGELSVTGLTTGYYMVEESQSPDGYVLSTTDSTFYIHVAGGEITYLVRSMDAADKNKKLEEWDSTQTSSGLVSYDKDTKTATVENEPGSSLPHTGGSGTRIFTILGALMIAGAGLLLLRKRRTI